MGIPGPNLRFGVSRSLQLGRAAGVATALGGQVGVYAQVTAVAFGIGALVERSVAVFTVIRLAGAPPPPFLGGEAGGDPPPPGPPPPPTPGGGGPPGVGGHGSPWRGMHPAGAGR